MLGESTHGSVSNEFGDRLKGRRLDTTATRILARLIAQAAKMLIRVVKAMIATLGSSSHSKAYTLLPGHIFLMLSGVSRC